MTPLEEKIRRAIREKADQVPADAVPPLLLPVRQRRPSSLAYGGQRTGTPARHAWVAPALSAVLVAAVIAGSVAVSRTVLGRHATGRPGHAPATPSSTTVPGEAAAWVAAQVSRSAVVSCDPEMCRELRAHGMPAGDLDVLARRGADPLDSDVIIATAAVRREFGSRLGSAYAPVIIASFGSESARVEVRVIAKGGAAAYLEALGADVAERTSAGAQLLHSPRITLSAAARTQVLAGHVDSRVMITIVTMSAPTPISILAFGDPGPGAGAGSPLRSVELAPTGITDRARSSASVRQMMTFLSAQKPPFAPALATMAWLAGGHAVLRIEFAAPGPLGLLNGNGG
jgi:hypothetical protein